LVTELLYQFGYGLIIDCSIHFYQAVVIDRFGSRKPNRGTFLFKLSEVICLEPFIQKTTRRIKAFLNALGTKTR